jgi:hypothetical protein
MQKISVTIDEDGTIQYDVKGVKGRSCKDLTKFIDSLAGGEVVESRNTGEFCEVETRVEREKN